MKDLGKASREELLEIIAALVARVEALEAENLRLRRGQGGGSPLWVKPSRAPKQKKERKRRKQAYVRRRCRVSANSTAYSVGRTDRPGMYQFQTWPQTPHEVFTMWTQLVTNMLALTAQSA